jgi:dTMP kinase
MLIVLEGLDGAGKSTQIKMLQEYFTQKEQRVKFLHFPRYDAPIFGDMISRFLRGDYGSNETVHPQLVALLYAADRAEAASTIREWLNDGYVVILDRYVYSNIGFQCSKCKSDEEAEELRRWIFNLEYNHYNIPKPEINIFLDVPIGFVDAKLKSNREGDDRNYLNGKGDIHEADINFQIGVRKEYLIQCDRDSNFSRIDCSDENGAMLPPDAIFNRIKSVLEGRI